jgi:epoxide hydrolase-like predicted phosphatase
LIPLIMIRAIIFDFGRVISAQKPTALFARYEKDLGLAPDSINAIMFGSDAWKDALLGRKTAQGFWYAIGPELGLKAAEDIDGFRCRYHADEAINPGVAELIHLLYGRTKLAVLSNSPPGLVDWLADWNIGHLFDVVFCSGDEGVVKPDPAAFEMTLGRLGVEPGEAVFIDDTLEHVRAAEALGIQGICFTTAEVLWDRLNGLLKSP